MYTTASCCGFIMIRQQLAMWMYMIVVSWPWRQYGNRWGHEDAWSEAKGIAPHEQHARLELTSRTNHYIFMWQHAIMWWNHSRFMLIIATWSFKSIIWAQGIRTGSRQSSMSFTPCGKQQCYKRRREERKKEIKDMIWCWWLVKDMLSTWDEFISLCRLHESHSDWKMRVRTESWV